jgi:hypothetical protein
VYAGWKLAHPKALRIHGWYVKDGLDVEGHVGLEHQLGGIGRNAVSEGSIQFATI